MQCPATCNPFVEPAAAAGSSLQARQTNMKIPCNMPCCFSSPHFAQFMGDKMSQALRKHPSLAGDQTFWTKTCSFISEGMGLVNHHYAEPMQAKCNDLPNFIFSGQLRNLCITCIQNILPRDSQLREGPSGQHKLWLVDLEVASVVNLCPKDLGREHRCQHPLDMVVGQY